MKLTAALYMHHLPAHACTCTHTYIYMYTLTKGEREAGSNVQKLFTKCSRAASEGPAKRAEAGFTGPGTRVVATLASWSTA